MHASERSEKRVRFDARRVSRGEDRATHMIEDVDVIPNFRESSRHGRPDAGEGRRPHWRSRRSVRDLAGGEGVESRCASAVGRTPRHHHHTRSLVQDSSPRHTGTLTALVLSGRAVEGCALARAPKTMSTAHRDPLRAHGVRRALLADGDGADGWWNDAHDQVRCAVPPRFFSARAPSRASTVPS